MKIKLTLCLALMLAASSARAAVSVAGMDVDAGQVLAKATTALADVKKIGWIQAINIPQLKSQFIERFNDVQPVALSIIQAIIQGNWEELRTALKRNDLNFEPLVAFLQINMDSFKQIMMEILKFVPADNATIKSAVDKATAMLPLLDSLKVQLGELKPYSSMTDAQKDAVVDALKAVANSPEYLAARPRLTELYNNVLAPAFDQAHDIDFSSLTSAVDLIKDKVASGKLELSLDDLPVLIDTLAVIRSLASLLPAVVQGMAQTFFEINQILLANKAITAAPKEIQDAAKSVAANAGSVKAFINKAFPALDNFLANTKNALDAMNDAQTMPTAPMQ